MILQPNQLAELRAEHRDDTIALRFGSFDLLHAGHAEALDFAAHQADILVVGVMSDDMVRRVKGPERPINPEASRVSKVDEAKEVDYSFITPSSTLAIAGLFLHLRPNVYVEHSEYGISRARAALMRTLGIRYAIDHGDKIDSTTSMIARMGLPSAIAHSALPPIVQPARPTVSSTA